ncbi:replication protein A 70 kDa DNA-binding subunit B-like isoform X2 [Phragmites australis]|uniref:replication protein A 70 kDa DNA-binding subunit B-like isoform X2 n=1 Tax=Phragmites australis TaxID=29695 RepID=UPI002D76D6EE|nr:replication protein A 70 kDa DNA-binding subunit B-like isoform X2 [Phragmites australis]
MAYKKLNELTTKGESMTIKVKVIRIWDSINNATDELMSLDMILLDEQGEVIHATIWKNLIDTYRPQINEKAIYAFSNFKVQESSRYRPLSNSIKIVFMYNTKVKQVNEESDKFQEYYFEFATKDKLLERENKDKQCSDIIGLLTSIKPVQERTIMRNTSSQRTKDIREIELLLLEGEKIRITLWGKLAHYLNEDVIGKHTVVIVTSTMVETSMFKSLSLKSTSATRLYTDLDVTETWQLIDRYSNDETLPKIMEVDKSIQGTVEEQMFYNRRTLQEITEMRHDNPTDQDFVFTSKARIDKIQENARWWYMSCKYCNKMCDKIDEKYYCNNCDKYPNKTTPRYFLRLQISDSITTTICTVFDDEAQRMVNTSISNLLDSLNGSCEDVPKIIQQLYGKIFIFRFKLSNQNLTEGKAGYLVKRTFVPNENLETKFLNDKDKKEDNTKDSPMKKTSNFAVHCEEDIEDRDESNIRFSACKRNNSLSRSRCIILDDDSDEDHTKRTTPKEKDTKVCSKKKKISIAKSRKETPKVEGLEFDEDLTKQKAILEQAIKTGIRLGKKINEKKRKCKDTDDKISRIKDPYRKRKGRNVIMETEIPTYQVEQTINSDYIEDDNNDKVTTNEYEIDVKKRKHKDTGAHTIRNKDY